MSQPQRMANSPTELVHHMMQQLKMEVKLANELGKDTQEGQNRLYRAQQLKMQLMNMQQQMQQRRQSQQAQQAQQQQFGNQGSPGPLPQQAQGPQGPQAQAQAQQLRMAQLQQQLNQKQHSQSPRQSPQPDQLFQAQAQQGAQGQQAPNRTVNMATANGFQQRFAHVEELRRHMVQINTRIQEIETALPTRTNREEVQKLQQQLEAIRARRDAVRQREMQLMRELRVAIDRQNQEQAQLQGQQSPRVQAQPPKPAPRQVPAGQQPAAQIQGQMLRGVPTNQQGQPVPPNQATATRAAQMRALQQQAQQHKRTAQGSTGSTSAPGSIPGAPGAGPSSGPSSAGNDASAPQSSVGAPSGPASSVPGAVGAGVGAGTPGSSGPNSAVVSAATRAMAQSMPIPPHLNVIPPPPAVARAGRPTLTNGGATEAQALNNPALIRAPPLDLQGDRLLSKRKLSDLVGSVMGEDNEPLIDADVEDLLLELADEFVTSVTSFACKLAKHRKSDVLEAKDIHLHLERNWNMHIAGYSSDEIRSIRRFMPTQAYQQKLQGIGMAKSVNK